MTGKKRYGKRKNQAEEIIDFFQRNYRPVSSLDIALGTGILRNSVTYHISFFQKENIIFSVGKKRDKTTHYLAKHYLIKK